MSLRDLVPWSRNREMMAEKNFEFPLKRLHFGINSLFDDFIERFDWPEASQKGVLTPRIDVAETEKEITVTAEMPGMDEKEIDISLEMNSLVIRGQKKNGERE